MVKDNDICVVSGVVTAIVSGAEKIGAKNSNFEFFCAIGG